MSRAQRRLLLLLLALPFLILGAALIYMAAMPALEGEPRDFWRALSWAAETLSTTGYGADSRWDHPLMVLFVVVLQFLGVFLVFLVFPIYLIPFLEERFEARLPTSAEDLEDHLLIYCTGPAVETLIDEVESSGLTSVVIEPDASAARRTLQAGHRVVHGGIDSDVFDRVSLAKARAVIANGTDDEDAIVVLTVRQEGFEGPVIAMVEEPNHRQPMLLAGASTVVTPRHILGAALAARASRKISPTVAGIQQIGPNLEVREVLVRPGSELAGRSLGEAAVGRRLGVTVIGQWAGGDLRTHLGADTRLTAGSILVVAGKPEAIDALTTVCGVASSLKSSGPFLIAGFGEVGRKVAELLKDAGEEIQVIDRQAKPEVDVVGDVLDREVLEVSRVRDAQAVILALDSDSATLFASVIVREFAPGVPVIARVNRAENVERIHAAGALFALSISQVSGQVLAGQLLGEEAVALDPDLKVMKVAVDGMEGSRPAELGIRERTGCSIVAVERRDDVMVDLGDNFEFASGDAIYLCGSSSSIRRFQEIFPQHAGV